MRTKLEIDFVASKGSKKYYVQSAMSVSDEKSVYRKPARYIVSQIRSKRLW